MKHTVLMSPDYGNSLFWNEEGCCIGGCDSLFVSESDKEIEVNLENVEGLTKWYNEWAGESLYHTRHWNDEQWRDWWERGMELAKALNQMLPNNVVLDYFSLNDPLWKVKPEDTNDGGVFNYGDPITLLKAGIYEFECYIMPWTGYELGSDCKYGGNNPIKVPLQLSYSDIQDIVDMMKWAWENNWMYESTSELLVTDLLRTRLPHMYDKVYPIAHGIFCTNHPDSEHIKGFGQYEIFPPMDIIEFAAFSSKTYYLK